MFANPPDSFPSSASADGYSQQDLPVLAAQPVGPPLLDNNEADFLNHFLNFQRLLLTAASIASQHVPNFSPRAIGDHNDASGHAAFTKRDSQSNDNPVHIVFICLIPILVLLSGLFAGLTLGYMSLDETQLNVLSISGTP